MYDNTFRYIFIRKKSKEVKNNPALKRQSIYIDQSYRKYTLLVLTLSTVWSLLLGLPPLFGWSSIDMEQERLACWLSPSGHYGIFYPIYFITGTVLVPMLVIMFVYSVHKRTVCDMTVKLQKNRHRSSVVKLAMRVTKASTVSVPRKSISSLSSVIIKDTQNFIRHPLTQEIHRECHLLRQLMIWGSVGIFTSLPYIVTFLTGSFLTLPPESTIVASMLFMCSPITTPLLITTLHDTVRKEMKKFLTDSLCFIADDVVPTAVVAPTAYRSGSKDGRESILSRRKSVTSQGEESIKLPERKRSQTSTHGGVHNSPQYGRAALTPIIERPSTSIFDPSPLPSLAGMSGDVTASPVAGRKEGMVVPPRRELLGKEVYEESSTGHGDMGGSGGGGGVKGRGGDRDMGGIRGEPPLTSTTGMERPPSCMEETQSTGGLRTHPRSVDSDDDMPQIT